jgi:high-affinity nickel permease
MNGLRSKLRVAAAALIALGVAMLALAPSAFAADGEGLWGRTTDFDVTMWGFAVIALFIILPIVLSIIQYKLDTRKERAREQLERVRKP